MFCLRSSCSRLSSSCRLFSTMRRFLSIDSFSALCSHTMTHVITNMAMILALRLHACQQTTPTEHLLQQQQLPPVIHNTPLLFHRQLQRAL